MRINQRTSFVLQCLYDCLGRDRYPFHGETSNANPRNRNRETRSFKPSLCFLRIQSFNQQSLHIKHPPLTLLCNSVIPSRTIFQSLPFSLLFSFSLLSVLLSLSTPPTLSRFHPQLSTIHSYQTFLPSVCRQILTSSAEALGKYNGVY